MNKHTEYEIKKEVKQIGLDIVVGLMIVALIAGFAIGARIAS